MLPSDDDPYDEKPSGQRGHGNTDEVGARSRLRKEALSATSEAIDIYRPLAARRPSIYHDRERQGGLDLLEWLSATRPSRVIQRLTERAH